MKIMQKRGLSLLLALVLVVSLFSGLTLPASAATYTYNWGYRGVTATELSSAAQAFYANNGTSYEALSAYSGSSSTSSVPSSDLYYQLKTLMVNNHSTITTYNGTKELYQYTDCQGGGGYISSFYSGKSIGPTWDGTWNREHTWPDSKGLEGSDEDDIMMLRPTATTENGARGNKAYGESSDCYDPNSESGGTYNLHGDVARIFLYVYVRWGNVNGNGTYDTWGSNGVMESKEILLKWMEEDPVDTWELGRNDAVQSITGTRNVFVDYPELAFLLFGEEIPTDMITPSGEAYNSGSSYTITAVSNDTAMGTVSVSGKNINASPADGHMAAGYTVLSGTAEVTQNGNVFAVAASTDCTIQINFKPKEQVAVTYLSNGTLLNTETVYDGDAFTLPDYTGTAPDGYTFIGWLDEQVDHTTTYPAVYKAGSSYTANGETTLYAVFSYISESTGDGTGTWTLVKETSELNAGDQIVFAANGYGAVAGTISSSVLSKIEATFSDDLSTIPELPDDALILTLGGSEGAWTLCNSDGALLGATAVKKLAWDKTTTTWSISISEGAATIQNGTASYGAIQYNIASPRFTTYTSSQSKPQIYKLDSAVTCYTTASCPHEDTYEEVAQAATCTSDGYTAGIYCYDCCTYISGHEVIPAPGHSYDAVVTPPTVTDDGYTTYTCSACGDSYVGDEVPALGEDYTVSFSVPTDAEAIEDMTCNTSGITLPAAAEIEGYTFLGWAEEEINNASAAPDYYEAGSTYTASADITLYALYYKVADGTGETSYKLVTNASQLKVGSKIVIAAADYDHALSTTQNTNNRGQADITKSGDTITLGEGVAELTLGEGTVDGSYSFYCETNSGYLYAASSGSNYLKTQTTLNANGSFAITVTEGGTSTLIAQGTNSRNNLQYNSSNKLFSCYSTTQKPVSLYIETTDGSFSYTTVIAHTHSGTYHEAVAATCESAGTIAYYSCTCGKNFSDEDCTIELDSIVDPQKDHDYTQQTAAEAYLKSAANCHEAAVYYYSCTGCGASSQGTDSEDVFAYGDVDLSNHDGQTQLTGQADNTCTAAGYTGDTVCLGCNNVIHSGSEIPASGHADAEWFDTEASTCKTHGVTGHYHCADCGGDYLEKTADAAAQSAEDLQLPLDPENHEGGTELKNQSDATATTDGYTGDTVCLGCGEVITYGETIPATGVAKIGDVAYASVESALSAAQSGETVTLVADTSVSTLLVTPGITLDLNGHTLETDYAVGFNGGSIVDNTKTKTGLLKVANGSAVLSKSNSAMAFWNGEGYKFGTFKTADKAAPVVDENGSLAYSFYTQISGALQSLVNDNGTTDNDVSVVIRLTWNTETGTAYQNYVYNDTQVAGVASGYFNATFELGNCTELKDLTLTAVIISETGVEIAGTTYQITE